MHPQWNPNTVRFDADIAILELEHEISFNTYIQPICLWNSFREPSVSSGVIVGYGISDPNKPKKIENTPRVLNVPIINQVRCFLNDPALANISSERTFCAGSADGSGACSGF